LRFPLSAKVALGLRVWSRYLLVRALLAREPLPGVVSRVGRPPRRRRRPTSQARLSRAVSRSLHVGSWRPTCLVASLVLFRLLREQGDRAEVVIGLPRVATTKDAHAWVELDGVDVGPPPGKGRHEAMARFC
jgi:hypothetical protein